MSAVDPQVRYKVCYNSYCPHDCVHVSRALCLQCVRIGGFGARGFCAASLDFHLVLLSRSPSRDITHIVLLRPASQDR